MIAGRFPIKPCVWISRSITALYLMLLLASIYLIEPLWAIMLAFAATSFSANSFYKQQQQQNQIGEELCWTGKNWLVDQGECNHQYLELDQSSWVTAYFCFLRFKKGELEKTWLFCRKSLGERLFRELCYLIKQQLIADAPINTKKH